MLRKGSRSFGVGVQGNFLNAVFLYPFLGIRPEEVSRPREEDKVPDWFQTFGDRKFQIVGGKILGT